MSRATHPASSPQSLLPFFAQFCVYLESNQVPTTNNWHSSHKNLDFWFLLKRVHYLPRRLPFRNGTTALEKSISCPLRGGSKCRMQPPYSSALPQSFPKAAASSHLSPSFCCCLSAFLIPDSVYSLILPTALCRRLSFPAPSTPWSISSLYFPSNSWPHNLFLFFFFWFILFCFSLI